MRWVALFAAASFSAAGCNSVLGIPERDLAEGDGSTDSRLEDSSLDSTTETDTSTDSELPDSSMNDSMDSASDATDTSMPDALETGAPDTKADSKADSMMDTTVVDTAMPDALDTGAPDTTMPDTTMPDTTMPDTLDTGAPDTTMDTAETASCGVAGKPCCGSVPASCSAGAVCNQTTGMCSAAVGACARSTDCTGNACGGPNNCGGNICYTCTAAFGSKAFGAACSAPGECASGVCDTFRGVCSAACSNGITADADCTGLGTKIVCSELNYTITGASGKIGLCAKGCDRDGDCPVGKTCTAASNADANRIDLTCTKPAGATAYGGACGSSNDCVGGLCFTSGVAQCTPFCSTVADCTGPWKNCSAVAFSKPKGAETQIVRLCTP